MATLFSVNPAASGEERISIHARASPNDADAQKWKDIHKIQRRISEIRPNLKKITTRLESVVGEVSNDYQCSKDEVLIYLNISGIFPLPDPCNGKTFQCKVVCIDGICSFQGKYFLERK